MLKSYLRVFVLTTLSLLSLMACVSNKIIVEPLPIQSPEQRENQLRKINQWKILGKIAFIKKVSDKQDRRESASLAWQVNEETKNQTLDLTSFLGINVLHLSSKQGEHLLKVDGKEYHSTNLTQLIYSLTGLTLPTQALSFWLKGLPYQANDHVVFDAKTKLPISMSSNYHNTLWHISYDRYQIFDQLPMATKFTIKKNGLTIKIAIKKWSLTTEI
ncbi:MAG: outer membrane lipoprotein LolB [Colwellia sp.]|nr:outer membrane lipoprotein LolB [Colwellia sp.]